MKLERRLALVGHMMQTLSDTPERARAAKRKLLRTWAKVVESKVGSRLCGVAPGKYRPWILKQVNGGNRAGKGRRRQPRWSTAF